MSEAETSNQQSLTLANSPESNPPAAEMIPATPATQSLSQQGIQGIDPTHNLISRNRNLLQRVGELEQALRQYQEELQFQQARAQTQETLLVQHKELLKASEEQVNRLFKELESSHQVNQRQQILIETLSNQGETFQERLAQLERDCALTQQRYQEQYHQLRQTESICEDLQVRLERQQQQTIQFKAALEKSLEVSTSSYLNSDPDEVAQFLLQNSREGFTGSLPSLSEELELLSSDYQDNLDWEHLIPDSEELSAIAGELETEEGNISDARHLTADPNDSHTINLPQLPKQLPPGITNVPVAESPEGTESVWDFWETAQQQPMQEILKDLSEPLHSEIEEAISGSLESETSTSDRHVSDSEMERDEMQSESLLSGANWPSPLVNPLRPTKRLKSWAAIDLPRFPKFRRSSN